MTALADQLAAAKSISDIESILLLADRRTMSFNDFVADRLDEARVAKLLDRYPNIAALAQAKNLITSAALLDAVDRIAP